MGKNVLNPIAPASQGPACCQAPWGGTAGAVVLGALFKAGCPEGWCARGLGCAPTADRRAVARATAAARARPGRPGTRPGAAKTVLGPAPRVCGCRAAWIGRGG